jgi:hypothetical protein
MENHSTPNTAKSNWALVAGLVPVVESGDLSPINNPQIKYPCIRIRFNGNQCMRVTLFGLIF